MKLAFERTCGNCDAFLANKDLQVKLGMPRQGFCRANPPTLVQVMMQQMTSRGMEMQPAFQGVFVPTASDCWCRQWKVASQIIDHEDIPDAADKPAA
jgi:hypothetical protein